jgi:hypothetical protein
MPVTGTTKSAALESLRRELGRQIKSGTELLQEREEKTLHLIAGAGGLEAALGGGLPAGQLTEIIGRGPSRGAGIIMAALLSRARREGRYVMLLDIGAGFSIGSFPERDLESLLWVGCDSATQAVEALDVATRDENFPLFLLDGRDCEPSDWKSVRTPQWYRILNQLRQREAVAVLFARSEVTRATKHRLELVSRLALEDLHRERDDILNRTQIRPGRQIAEERAGQLRVG